MTYMLCRHKVADYAHWKNAFDSSSTAQHNAGLKLELLWCGIDDPNEVFMLFEVEDVTKARAYVTSPVIFDARQKTGIFNKPKVYIINDDFQ